MYTYILSIYSEYQNFKFSFQPHFNCDYVSCTLVKEFIVRLILLSNESKQIKPNNRTAYFFCNNQPKYADLCLSGTNWSMNWMFLLASTSVLNKAYQFLGTHFFSNNALDDIFECFRLNY